MKIIVQTGAEMNFAKFESMEIAVQPLERTAWRDNIEALVRNGKCMPLETMDGFIVIPARVLAGSIVTVRGIKPEPGEKK